jgi:hypothetical protein
MYTMMGFGKDWKKRVAFPPTEKQKSTNCAVSISNNGSQKRNKNTEHWITSIFA